MSVIVNKELMKDTMGRPITQSMFYEFEYKLTPQVQFTLSDQDKIIDDRNIWSLKRLFLEMEDITEYNFASTYLLGWKHWKKMDSNKFLGEHFNEWRQELEYKIKANAIEEIIMAAQDGQNFAAAKWLAEGGWDKKGAGRPSKSDIMKQVQQNARSESEFDSDSDRLRVINGGK